MTVRVRFSLPLIACLSALPVAAAAPTLAQTLTQASGQTEFRDPTTGKIWTPDNVGTGRSTEPPTAADRAFDPRSQASTTRDVGVQAPSIRILGSVPITAGPTVPVATIDEAALTVIPAQRWQVTLRLDNNSAGTINPVVECRFTNGGSPVEDARASLPPVAGGQRVGFVVYGPPSTLFVDRADCRLASLS
ncbi:MAG: hypothetical protein FJX11_08180 [Alphaproteobacteria bacterium]|nr:hypothetical protein [Alphaproteobacteria bacterium]